MPNWTQDWAEEELRICSGQKKDIEDSNIVVESYYHNTIAAARGIFPTNYVNPGVKETLPFTNLFPFGTRVWLSVVLGAPFGIEVTPGGARDAMGIKKLCADGLNLVNMQDRQTPEFRSMMRRMATQALLYNQVAIYDGIDFNRKPLRPFYQIINWRDFYIEPMACEPLNEYRAACWAAVRLWLRPDEAELAYGAKRLKTMHQGILPSMTVKERDREIFRNMYAVMHWWGIDVSESPVRRGEIKKDLEDPDPGGLWQLILRGQAPPAPEDEPHRTALEVGDQRFIDYIKEQTGQEAADLNQALTVAEQGGRYGETQGYLNWRMERVKLLEDKKEGETRMKYPGGGVYHAEFQEGMDEPLLDAEPSPYKHGQIPISAACRHEGTGSYWTLGIGEEALGKQQYIEYLERERNVNLKFQAEPMFWMLRDYLPEEYRNGEEGLDAFKRDVMTGRKLMPLSGIPPGLDPSKLMGWIEMKGISYDVQMILKDQKNEFMELFGAAEIMRGVSPGSEASGKHIQLKMEAASRPSTFMLSLLEGPIHKHRERYTINVLSLADPEWLSQICSPEQVAAIMAVRETGEFNYVVRVNLGSGMPTEWVDRFGIYQQLIGMGFPADPRAQILAKEMGIPLPSEAEIAASTPPVPPTAPGTPGGTVGPGGQPPPQGPPGPPGNVNMGA